jgi:hypothetical protein
MGADEIWDSSVDMRNLERLELERRRLGAFDGQEKPVKRGRGGKVIVPIGVQLDD